MDAHSILWIMYRLHVKLNRCFLSLLLSLDAWLYYPSLQSFQLGAHYSQRSIRNIEHATARSSEVTGSAARAGRPVPAPRETPPSSGTSKVNLGLLQVFLWRMTTAPRSQPRRKDISWHLDHVPHDVHYLRTPETPCDSLGCSCGD